MKTAHYILLFFLISISLFSQDHGRLRGFVTDSTNGEPLAFCNVFIPEIGIGTSTDQRGYYLLNDIPSMNRYTILFSYIGYKTKEIDVSIQRGRITELDVDLVPSSYEFGTVEKVENKITQQDKMDLGVERLTLRDLESLPQSVESDIIRSLKHLPGVASTGDISAKYYVRGGTGDQNLILLNGITLYNPFHALGLFSVVDAEMVNSVEFFKGDFPAEYGSRLSSVMNVFTKNGNKNRISATSSLSLMTGKVMIEGPIDHGSFILTGRKSYSTAVLDNFLTEDDVPVDFYDFSFKANYANQEFIENGRFSVFGFFSGDNFNDPKPRSEDYRWRNNLFGLEWVQIYDKPFFSRFQFSYSNFVGEVLSDGSNIKPRYNAVTDFTFAAEFTLVLESEDQITVGLDFKNIKTELEQENENASLVELSDFSGNYILYSKYELMRFDEIGIDAGLRMYMSGLSEKGGFSIEPRIKGFWNPVKPLLFKASVGSYRQEIATITDENEVISLFDPWTIYPDYLEATRSLNFSAGVEYFLSSSTNLSLEGYYKKVNNLAAINERKIFPDDPPLINGDGKSYGLESKVSVSLNQFTFSAAYTLSWAYKIINGVEFFPKYDSRHNVDLTASYLLGDGWKFGITWTYNSGYPFTPLRGYFDRYEIVNFFEDNPAADQYTIFTILGNKNTQRLPDYHRMDVSVSKEFELGFVRGEISGSIINVYDRANIFYFKRETGERVNMLPFLPTASIKIIL